MNIFKFFLQTWANVYNKIYIFILHNKADFRLYASNKYMYIHVMLYMLLTHKKTKNKQPPTKG